MERLPPIDPPAIVRAADPTLIPADAIESLEAWHAAKESPMTTAELEELYQREEAEAICEQMEAAEMQEDSGRFRFDSML